jgi:hypothetical protein
MQPALQSRSATPLTLIALSLAIGGTSLPAQTLLPPGTPKPVPVRGSRFSDLPPTEPTTLPPAPPQPAPAPLPTGNALPAPIAATPNTAEPPATRPHRAVVTFLDGQLNVRANDSSLNQILRAISRETGLKITGGVKDQRVFGDYGPASTSSILATLLDGTGTNIVLLEGDPATPPELILTPRGGGPTPPSPTDPGYVDDSIEATAPPPPPPQQQVLPNPQPANTQPTAAQTSGPPSIPQPLNNVNGSPLNTSPTASTFPTTNSVPTDSLLPTHPLPAAPPEPPPTAPLPPNRFTRSC